MILFAGGWSDKRGRRKPCMLIPMLGELAALIGKTNKKSFIFLKKKFRSINSFTLLSHFNSLFDSSGIFQAIAVGI